MTSRTLLPLSVDSHPTLVGRQEKQMVSRKDLVRYSFHESVCSVNAIYKLFEAPGLGHIVLLVSFESQSTYTIINITHFLHLKL